jgi:hypothetical protein
MDLSPDIKTVLDIGLGALSLMLWFRQGKVNKAQLQLDEKQNKATEDLTKMVRDHDDRIAALETEHLSITRRKQKAKR